MTGRHYKLLRELGSGTFGTVYQAEMQSAGGFRKKVALKILHPNWEHNQDAGRRFRDEARLLGQLSHRHIIRVDGLVRMGGRWAVVMEYVPGCDGNTVIKACRKAREPFPVPAALEIVHSVASALDAAYNARPEGTPLRVIHRDIKPSNLRLTPDGDIKVLDFGIARAQFRGREAITRSIRYGSVRYMAPERRLSEPDTPAGDVYSLGCVLYEFLIGRPFGNTDTDEPSHNRRVQAALATVRRRMPGEMGSKIIDLLGRMLAFDQDARPVIAEVEARSRALARTAEGADLATFARLFIPRVFQYVADQSLPVDRVVSMDDTGVVDNPPAAKTPSRATNSSVRRDESRQGIAIAAVATAALAAALLLISLELAERSRTPLGPPPSLVVIERPASLP